MSAGAGPPGAERVPDGAASSSETAGEVELLRAERDAAIAALNKEGRRKMRRARARRMSAVALVVIFAILLPVTITATWAHRTVLSTSGYVATVAPIAASPAVQSAVSRATTDAVYSALNPQQVIASALPPKAAKLAGPLSSGAKDSCKTASARSSPARHSSSCGWQRTGSPTPSWSQC